MKIEKIINNNIIMSFDENQKEVIAVGRGLGYQKKSGDTISENNIEKLYVIAEQRIRKVQ